MMGSGLIFKFSHVSKSGRARMRLTCYFVLEVFRAVDEIHLDDVSQGQLIERPITSQVIDDGGLHNGSQIEGVRP